MDRHIDNDETQVYGPKLRENLASAFAASAPPVKAFLAHLAKLQADADRSMAAGMEKARGARSSLSAAASAKSPEIEIARKLLKGLHGHLGSKRSLGEWSGDPKLFFPKGLTGVGTSAPEVVTALGTAIGALKKDPTVPDGAKLKKLLAASEKKLRGHVAASGGAVAAARKGLSEQSAEKKGWLTTYRGISLIAEGLLTLEGRAPEVRSVVPHLSVPGGPRKPRAARKTKPAKTPAGDTP